MPNSMNDAELDDLVRQVVQSTMGEASTGQGAGPAAMHKVAIAADHRGQALKAQLITFLDELGHAVIDCDGRAASSDYPDLAEAVAISVASGEAWRGILIDGAGIGSCMAANKVPGVRAALCYNHATAVNSRQHNDANVLALGSGLIGPNLARAIVQVWLGTPFGGGRHAPRVAKIKDLERRYARASKDHRS